MTTTHDRDHAPAGGRPSPTRWRSPATSTTTGPTGSAASTSFATTTPQPPSPLTASTRPSFTACSPASATSGSSCCHCAPLTTHTTRSPCRHLCPRAPSRPSRWRGCPGLTLYRHDVRLWGREGGRHVDPVVRTKLFIPQLRRGLVARARLDDRLGDRLVGTERPRLTLVSAPPGFGKTTLLAGGSTRRRPGIQWLGVARGDRAAARLVLDLRVTALRTAVPGVGAGVLPLLAVGPARRSRPSSPPCSTSSARCRTSVDLVLDDYHLVDGPGGRGRHGVPARAPAPARAPGDQHPGRPRPAAGPAAGPRRAGRGPCRRPALHARRGDGVPQRRRRAGPGRRATSPPWRGAPRAGSPRSSWRRCRCRDGTTPPGSSPASPATTGTSSTTSSRRSWVASPTTVRRFLLETSILDRLSGPLCDAVTGGQRRQGRAGGAGPGEPVRRRRSTTAGTGTATTTCSPTCCAHTCWRSGPTRSPTCTAGRADWYDRAGSRCPRSATRSPPVTSSGAADLVELAIPACCAEPAGGHGPRLARRHPC